tara:strand:+ start:167 stop:340 length:174 start_codon:yes stop_codon:yes gene_type:complete
MSNTVVTTQDDKFSKKKDQTNTTQENKIKEKPKIDLDKLRKSEGFRRLGDQLDYWSD